MLLLEVLALLLLVEAILNEAVEAVAVVVEEVEIGGRTALRSIMIKSQRDRTTQYQQLLLPPPRSS